MFLPYKVDVPMERVPIANWVLIGATVVISIAGFIDQGSEIARISNSQAPISLEEFFRKPAFEALPLNMRWALWRGDYFRPYQLVTGLLVHDGVFHLVGNMFFLFVFGNAVNAKLGQVWYIFVYFFIGIAESLIWLWIGSSDLTLGASAAICGIMGLFVVYYPRNDVSLLRLGLWEWRLLPEAISSVWLILFYIAWDVWGTVSAGDGVGYISHVVGMILGVGIAVLLLRTHFVDTPEWEQNLLQVLGLERSEQPVPKKSKTIVKKKRSNPSRLSNKPKPSDDVSGWG